MNRQTSAMGMALLVVVAALALGGCSTYRPARLPTAAELAPPPENSKVPVYKGMHVRVTLTDGTKYSGEVARVDENELAIGKVGNYGLEEHVIRRGEIASMDVVQSTRAGNYLGSTVGLASLGFLALLVLVGIGLNAN